MSAPQAAKISGNADTSTVKEAAAAKAQESENVLVRRGAFAAKSLRHASGQKAAPAPGPAALENPYTRYYTRTRSFSDLLPRRPEEKKQK